MNHPQKHNEIFQKALSGLNEEQLKAVNHIEGPVLVIAGPGTGKTQILAARIGKILTETDTEAHNILCLTYTDAGTIAMRKRLVDFIGPDAYRVHIYTFHAFCNEIIQENLDYFGKLELEPISELEEAALFKELIDSFSPSHILKRFTGEVYFETARLKNLFSVMKREDWMPEFISQKIDDYICSLPLREEFLYKKANEKKNIKAGDLKQHEIDKEVEKMNMLRAAVSEYPNYLKLMKKNNRYDYDDMILWVLNAFKKDENFLITYQERYQYVLVDEYQDTSGSQNELLKLLISYWDQPNVFVVGDDDQSIFRFQGANLANILDFAQEYSSHLYKVVLTQNYRSTQVVLDAAKTVIDLNEERLTHHLNLNKNLKAANSNLTAHLSPPEIREYETAQQEIIHVSNEIIRLISEGVNPGEIAVIYHKHIQGEPFAGFLEKQQIAVNIKRRVDILSLPFTQKIITILRYLSLEIDSPYSGDELLFEIMHYDFFNIAPIDIAKISIEVSKKNYAYNNTTKDQSKYAIRRMIAELSLPQKADLFSDQHQVEIKKFSEDIEYWIKEAQNVTLQELFEKIILKAGILKYIMQSDDKNWYMQVLTGLFDFLKEENRKYPDITIKEFIQTIDLMVKNKIRLSLNRSTYHEHGVNFMTAHGSKGLEFEYVFLIGCQRKIWEGKRKNGTLNYRFPDTLLNQDKSVSELEELRRLFYVAMTRAKHSLAISYASRDEDGKEVEPSQFIVELAAGTSNSIQKIHLPEEQLIEFQVMLFEREEKPVIELIDENYINHLLEGYTLSVTHLSSYLDCPLRFYFQNLIRVPCGKTPSTTFGQAVHWSLNKLFLKMKENGDVFPDQTFFLEHFFWYMNRNRDSFTKEEFKLRVEYGYKILPDYYNFHVEKWNKIVLTEKKIKNVEIKGVPITGNLDKIEFSGKYVNVVDYKTGKFKNAELKLQPPSEADPVGGDYWRQAVFYKILLDNDKTHDWITVSSEFDFIEPIKEKEYKKVKLEITDQDVKLVTDQITSTYSKILNHEFSKGCGKPECHWCNFVKSNFKEQNILIPESEE